MTILDCKIVQAFHGGSPGDTYVLRLESYFHPSCPEVLWVIVINGHLQMLDRLRSMTPQHEIKSNAAGDIEVVFLTKHPGLVWVNNKVLMVVPAEELSLKELTMSKRQNSAYYNMNTEFDPKLVRVIYRFMTMCEQYQFLVLEYVGPRAEMLKEKYFYVWTHLHHVKASSLDEDVVLDTSTQAGHFFLRKDGDFIRFAPVMPQLAANDSNGKTYKNETQFNGYERVLVTKIQDLLCSWVAITYAGEQIARESVYGHGVPGWPPAKKQIGLGRIGDKVSPAVERPTLEDIYAIMMGNYCIQEYPTSEDRAGCKMIKVYGMATCRPDAKAIFEHITGAKECTVNRTNEKDSLFVRTLNQCCKLFGDPFPKGVTHAQDRG